MIQFLRLLHVLICCLAIGLGALTLSGILRNRLIVQQMIWFLRCSLSSSIAVLLLSLHHLIPAQVVAIISVYAASLVILAWRAFHFMGAWRPVFAFALAIVVYLNVEAMAIQIPSVRGTGWSIFQTALFTAAMWMGTLAARRFSLRSIATPLGRGNALGARAVHPWWEW
jgi:hypothetical protein